MVLPIGGRVGRCLSLYIDTVQYTLSPQSID